MDTVRAHERTRWVTLLLCALGLAVGWSALSFALGMGVTASHAADDEGRDGLLSSLADTVEDAASVLPDVVEKPAATVVDRVAKTTEKTVATVTETVDTVVKAKPVTTVTGAVSGTVKNTVKKTVKKVPVVGTVVEDLGATDLVDAVGDTADDVLTVVDRTVDDVIDGIVTSPPSEAVSPDEETDPSDPAGQAGGTDTSASAPVVPPTTSAIAAADGVVVPASWRAVDVAPAVSTAATYAATSAVATATATGDRNGHPAGVPSPLAAPPVSLISSGSSGAFAAAGLVPSSALPHAHDAWLRGSGNDDENAPPGPPAAPDVAPD